MIPILWDHSVSFSIVPQTLTLHTCRLYIRPHYRMSFRMCYLRKVVLPCVAWSSSTSAAVSKEQLRGPAMVPWCHERISTQQELWLRTHAGARCCQTAIVTQHVRHHTAIGSSTGAWISPARYAARKTSRSRLPSSPGISGSRPSKTASAKRSK